MNKRIFNICIIIFLIVFLPIQLTFALHDDETVGKGGAWDSSTKSKKTVSTDKEESIDTKLEKTFKKSPIIIPEVNDDETEEMNSENEETSVPDKN